MDETLRFIGGHGYTVLFAWVPDSRDARRRHVSGRRTLAQPESGALALSLAQFGAVL